MIKELGIIFRDREQQLRAGKARLDKEDDNGVTTVEQAEAYRGPTFVAGETCDSILYAVGDGVVAVCVSEEGQKTEYVYPLDTVSRIHIKHEE